MKKKPIPELATEAAELEFWSNHDSTEYLDWSQAETVTVPNLRPSLKTISLRLPVHLLAGLKMLANKQDVPYQSLLKTYLADRVRQELTGYSYPVSPMAFAGFEVHEPDSAPSAASPARRRTRAPK